MSLNNFEIEHEKIENEPKTEVEKKEKNDSLNINVSGKNCFYYAKNILYPFINLFYHILLKSIHKITSPKRTIYKYQTTLVLIFKDEAPFLQEWLTYHLTLGIDHFYLYQNNSTDNYMEVLSNQE